ncbi:hypothetical protein BDW62DRAFT_216834 [Aspergillus aurantiobrunneus]
MVSGAKRTIIYAGGSCVTLDPALPDAQVLDRLVSLGTRSIIVDAASSKRDFPYRSIVVDDVVAATVNAPLPTIVPLATTLSHRTHLIHTSGTTSKLKAVQLVAKSIVYVANYCPFEPVRKSDVVAHGNSTSFDGAGIAVLSKLVLIDPLAFAAAVKRYGITAMTITAPLINLIANACPAAFSTCRVVLMGGEAVNVAAMDAIFKAGPPENMVNAYGRSECCMFCLARRITKKDIQSGHISIGLPIGRNVAVLCDELGEPLPDEEREGELVVGGPGVSPGYVGLPEKNAAVFLEFSEILDPSGQPYRMYRTGDIVKQRPDGQHDFYGRRDEQVKVSGYRIELSAMNSAVVKTGYFSEAVVLSVPAKNDVASSVLVAFVVVRPDAPGTAVADAKEDHAKIDRKRLVEAYRHGRTRSLCQVQHPREALEDTSSTRGQLATLWEGIFGIPAASYADDGHFFSLGGTSLQASLLITKKGSLGELTTILGANRGGLKTIDDQREVWVADTKVADYLQAPIGPVVDWQRDTEGRVSVTGATRFLGAFFLVELLRNPSVRQIGCLVRASDPSSGLRRLRDASVKYGLWRDEYAHKLLPLCRALEEEYLGLGGRGFTEIANRASVVFHIGARVNYTQPYSYHRPANIQGTVRVVQLACTGRPKGVHYVSSISAFGPTGFATGSNIIYENEPLMKHLNAVLYDHGYAQSQWVVDQLLERLIQLGVPIAVYRPGFITGHAKTGACNPDDFLSRLLRACCDIKCYPALGDQRKEFVTVDYICAAMLHISCSVFSLGHSFHLVPPSRADSIDLDRAMDMVSAARSSKIEKVSYAQWIERLSDSGHPSLQPLLPMLAEKVHNELSRWELYEGMPTYDATNTLRALAGYPGGLAVPVLNEGIMGRYLDFLER